MTFKSYFCSLVLSATLLPSVGHCYRVVNVTAPGQHLFVTRTEGSTLVVCNSPSTPSPDPMPAPQPPAAPVSQGAPVSPYYYVSLDDYAIVHRAIAFGIGSCKVFRRVNNSHCAFYIQANGVGYPMGSGCVNAFGDQSGSIQNTAFLLRQAINGHACN